MIGSWLLGLLLFPAACRAGGAERVELAAKEISRDILGKIAPDGGGIAVLHFENPDGRTSGLGRALAEGLTREIVADRRFMVLDRDYTDQMLAEIRLGFVGLTDQAAALSVGRFSAARYLLVGRIEPVGGKEFLIQARLLETRSSRLVSAAKFVMKSNPELLDLYAAGGPAPSKPTALGESARLLEESGPAGCRWVESKVEVPVLVATEAARAEAIALARQKTHHKLLGGEPETGPDFGEEAFQGRLEELLRATQSSMVLGESIIRDQFSDGRYALSLRQCLAPPKGRDGGLKAELLLNQSRFFAGQEARAIIVANRDAYVYLYSVDFSLKAGRVHPSARAEDNKVSAGKPFVFPDEKNRKAGIRVVAELPPGSESSIETLRLLAVDGDIGNMLDGVDDYKEIVRRLMGSGREWTEDIRVFTIYRR